MTPVRTKRAAARLQATEPVDIEDRLAPFFLLPYDRLLSSEDAAVSEPELAPTP